jgi:hypothetical protein
VLTGNGDNNSRTDGEKLETREDVSAKKRFERLLIRVVGKRHLTGIHYIKPKGGLLTISLECAIRLMNSKSLWHLELLRVVRLAAALPCWALVGLFRFTHLQLSLDHMCIQGPFATKQGSSGNSR